MPNPLLRYTSPFVRRSLLPSSLLVHPILETCSLAFLSDRTVLFHTTFPPSGTAAVIRKALSPITPILEDPLYSYLPKLFSRPIIDSVAAEARLLRRQRATFDLVLFALTSGYEGGALTSRYRLNNHRNKTRCTCFVAEDTCSLRSKVVKWWIRGVLGIRAISRKNHCCFEEIRRTTKHPTKTR